MPTDTDQTQSAETSASVSASASTPIAATVGTVVTGGETASEPTQEELDAQAAAKSEADQAAAEEALHARVIAAQTALKQAWVNLLHDAGATLQGSGELASEELKEAEQHLEDAAKLVLSHLGIN